VNFSILFQLPPVYDRAEAPPAKAKGSIKMNDLTQIKLLQKLYDLETNGNTNDSAAIKKVEESLDPPLLKRYLKLKERKGTAVALLRDGVCSGCNIEYPNTHEVLRHEKFIHTCEFCGRFLLVSKTNKAEDE